MRRHRLLLAASAGLTGLTFLGRPLGWAIGAGLFAATWWVAGRVEPPDVRRSRQESRRQLPHVVRLLGLALSAGAPLSRALAMVEEAFPGAATHMLRQARSRLELGTPAAVVWSELTADPVLAPLGRALARADNLGAAPAPALARLADDLSERARGEVEDRARAVGIRAALPLGLCLLPAFLVLGIVPVVVGVLSTLRW